MRTLKLKGQPRHAFFAAVNQMFGGSPILRRTYTELCFVVWTVHDDLVTARLAVVGSWQEAASIW